MNLTQKKVVVALRMAGIAGQDKLNGIFEHLSNGTRWQLSLYRSPEEFTPETVRQHLREGVDGFLIGLPNVTPALAELARTDVPTILMNVERGPLRRRQNNLFLVKGDGLDVGHKAAAEFLRYGTFNSFVYLRHAGDPEWSRERGQGFAEILKQKGTRTIFVTDVASLRSRLKTLKRPIALFASCDDDAYQALNLCQETGCVVPGEVSILGVNNDTLLCENANPRLSSIQQDNVGEGRLAARLLERMMSDYARNPRLNRKAKVHLVPIREIVIRDSTPPKSASDAVVQRALTFIRQRALHGIRVENVAMRLGVSRSLLDLRFRECIGDSVYNTILRLRLDEVKRRLRTTSQPLERIASECGWSNVRSLMNVFKRTFGVSMTRWRRHND